MYIQSRRDIREHRQDSNTRDSLLDFNQVIDASEGIRVYILMELADTSASYPLLYFNTIHHVYMIQRLGKWVYT
jgi:hypothetical protein